MRGIVPKLGLLIRRLRKGPQWIRLIGKSFLQRNAPELAATSMDLCDDPHLPIMLGGQKPQFYSRLHPPTAPTIIGWGQRWSGQRATTLAQATGRRCLLIEDGFLRSVGRRDAPLSIVTDDCGIYYDAQNPSQIETHIAAPLTPTEAERATCIAALWRAERVSKYNNTSRYDAALPEDYVLVIDQVAGDLSITAGAASAEDFTKMLDTARLENPTSTILLKTHPDLHSHAKYGHFDLEMLAKDTQIQLITDACHPVRLIANARTVYTVTSQVGFEALIWGKPVRCFGMPFYAGYGLTQDDKPPPSRRSPATLAQLIHGALVKYPRYLDPETQALTEVESAIRYIGHQRRLMNTVCGTLYALGFSRWKQPILKQFLPGADIQHIKNIATVPDGANITVWGNRSLENADRFGQILRIEDGFLRSSGLGADLIQPMSWAFDDLGIYYDPRTPSRLECILQAKDHNDDVLARSDKLIGMLCASGISKYNIGARSWARPDTKRPVILVPGQVESDASIRCGAPKICTNMGLLRAVRVAHPNAYLIYKPHPDVVAGLRHAGATDNHARRVCDEIITDTDPITMLHHVDEVHTMTSLLGFEALLRGVKVTCYGQPFYAGWGLTQDTFLVSRRTAHLTLPELVAGTLIAYPRYVSRTTGALTSPERAIAELADWRRNGPSQMPLHRRMLRSVLRLWVQSNIKRSA